VDNFVDKMTIFVDNSVNKKNPNQQEKVIHKLSTGYPQGYPHDKQLFLNKKIDLSTEFDLTNNNNIYNIY
jgi:hypothetical protein